MSLDPTIIQFLLPVAAAAAAWGGSRQALNGTRERVKTIDEKMDKHVNQTAANFSTVTERIAVVETKVDDLKHKVD